MDISFRKASTLVVAKVDCSSGHRWNEAKEIEWRLEWKLRFQISITPVGGRYGLGEPQLIAGEPLMTDRRGVWFRVRDDAVFVEFTLPDCLGVLQGGSWGCSVGGPVALAAGTFHCQALMYAKPPGLDSSLRMSPEGLEFCTSHLGVAAKILVMPRTLPNRYEGRSNLPLQPASD